MENPDSSVNAIKHIMATIFSAQNALRELAPEYNWAGMGNLLGDYGEFYCVETYKLSKAPSNSSGFDAFTEDGKTVQIKANHASNSIGFRGEADLMLVVHIQTSGEVDELYFGPFESVKNASSYSQRDNKHAVTISKLRSLAAENLSN